MIVQLQRGTRTLVVFGRDAPEIGSTTDIDGVEHRLMAVVAWSDQRAGIYDPTEEINQ